MTQVDVVLHFLTPPRESSVLALNSLREVYGIRKIDLNERLRTIHIEYDGTRLSEQGIRQLMRRTGIDLAENHTPQPVPDEAAPAA